MNFVEQFFSLMLLGLIKASKLVNVKTKIFFLQEITILYLYIFIVGLFCELELLTVGIYIMQNELCGGGIFYGHKGKK